MKLLYPLEHYTTVNPGNGYGPRPSFPIGDGRWSDPMHRGTDFTAPAGTPIRAMADGKVIKNSWDTTVYDGGIEIWLDHGDGLTTRYLHRRALTSHKIGAKVKAGDVIGQVGSTGFSTGPHAHVEGWRNGSHFNIEPFLVKTLPTPRKTRKMYSSSNTITGGLSIAKGATKNLPFNKAGSTTIPNATKATLVTGGAYIAGGTPGTGVQLVIRKVTTDPKTKKSTNSVMRRVSSVFDSSGKARLQVTGLCKTTKDVRYRIAVQNDSNQTIKVTRVTLDRIKD